MAGCRRTGCTLQGMVAACIRIRCTLRHGAATLSGNVDTLPTTGSRGRKGGCTMGGTG
jgi:hypothetical protein